MNKINATSELPEVWGGLECTVNRVGDRYCDQLVRTGHDVRASDLDLIAHLGIRTLRYPVLWERTWPDPYAEPDWTWTDERLGQLRDLGIRSIVGLVHHGSGPRHTNLLDPNFATGLARLAGLVAERYPWVDAYTPVNEPLTTARFSALYGHWYPHARTDLDFTRALLNECRAVVMAMRAIREVNPAAILVQTEDLGKTYSTASLAYQAEFDNERRWLTFDLMLGRVDPRHRMWGHMRWLGIEEVDLRWFLENTSTPGILGANYYLTGERFLDERVNLYPPHTRGSNGRHTYSDVEAVRVRAGGLSGPKALFRELWERYKLPVAVTEVHNGCTRDEQLRWLLEAWEAAKALRSEGADLRAITVWSLFGVYDWDGLLTVDRGYYEPGVFDLRSPEPRPTAMAHLVRELAAGREHSNPVLDSPGWWRRSARLIYGFSVEDHQAAVSEPVAPAVPIGPRARPLLILGATGTLGRAFARLAEHRGLPYRLLSRHDMDICQPRAIGAVLDEHEPWAVINAAGYVRVDDAEGDSETCYRVNTHGPSALAAACATRHIRLVTFSSDLVFDGSKGAPYLESDMPSPLNVYGLSKARAEALVLGHMPGALVVRTSAFFGPWDQYNFVINTLRTLASGETMFASTEWVSPTYVPDLVHACLDLLIDGESGIWHLANNGATTWADFARRVAEMAGLDTSLVRDRLAAIPKGIAARPLYSVLGSERAWIMPTLDIALECFFHDCSIDWRAPELHNPRIDRPRTSPLHDDYTTPVLSVE